MKRSCQQVVLDNFWEVTEITESGLMRHKNGSTGYMFDIDGLDAAFLTNDQLTALHHQWRSVLRLLPGEELQIVYRKRVAFTDWVEDQLSRSFLADNTYGRRILLDRLADQVAQMSKDSPQLLSQKILACFWTPEPADDDVHLDKRHLIRSQLSSFGFAVRILNGDEIRRQVTRSAQDLNNCEQTEPEWPAIKIEAGQLQINKDRFRALELTKLPENFTELGMVQTVSKLPYPIDISIRLKGRDTRPIVTRLERKRNLLNAQRNSKSMPSPSTDSQIEQIMQVLRCLADQSEWVYDLNMTIGLRLPAEQTTLQRKALAQILRTATQMNFCEFEEATLEAFDCYLECLPGFSGKNLSTHTVLGSNAIHLMPLFRPAAGDAKPVVTFSTASGSVYGIDPVDPKLANYNWLVSGTSGAGKSFFVNSLLAQSLSIDPNIFIVDIGGSYNKLTQFLGGRLFSLEPGTGFSLSPFFLPQTDDPQEERLRRQHIFKIFLEMTRMDGQLPALELRHLMYEHLTPMFDSDSLADQPISELFNRISQDHSPEAHRLALLLQPWTNQGYFGQFLDTNKSARLDDRIVTFDLKGLTEFEDLSRVIQFLVCASLWARIRQCGGQRFSWIVLDEVAFSLLKTQPDFVDELVSTLRKHFGGAIIVVQDLEKVTSNLAGSSILQNTHSKAILQQRGDPKNYAEPLSLSSVDQWAIESLRREKGSYSDIFLLRDKERTVIRHVPSELEYWLATTAPEDTKLLNQNLGAAKDHFQKRILNFAAHRNRVGQ